MPRPHLTANKVTSMNPIAARIAGLIAPVIGDMGLELVGVEYGEGGRGGLLRVYIECAGDCLDGAERGDQDAHKNGVSVSDCEAVSHRVSGLLDVEDLIAGRYALEVSSPGLDRPLFTAEQYRRFVSRRVKVVMAAPQAGRRRFSGVLRACAGGMVAVEVDNELHELPLAQVASARLIPEFSRSKSKQ